MTLNAADYYSQQRDQLLRELSAYQRAWAYIEGWLPQDDLAQTVADLDPQEAFRRGVDPINLLRERRAERGEQR